MLLIEWLFDMLLVNHPISSHVTTKSFFSDQAQMCFLSSSVFPQPPNFSIPYDFTPSLWWTQTGVLTKWPEEATSKIKNLQKKNKSLHYYR